MRINFDEYDSTAVFVFLAITWNEENGEHCDAFGPFLVRQDGAHLDEIQAILRDWPSRHPKRPNMAAHLFATGYEKRLDLKPERAGA